MSGWAALGQAASEIFGDARQLDFQQRLNSKQMSFQDYMSSTSWQRSVGDMKRAGINPMLAVMKGGAESGAGASGSAGSRHADYIAGQVGSAQIAHINAQTRNTNAEADRNEEIASVLKAIAPRIVQGVGAVESGAQAAGNAAARIEEVVRRALSNLENLRVPEIGSVVDEIVKRLTPSLPNLKMPEAIKDVESLIKERSEKPAGSKPGEFGAGASRNVWGLSEYERAQRERFERARKSPASRRRGGSR